MNSSALHATYPTGGSLGGLLAVLRAAGEPTRLRLLALCAHAELTVSELVGVLGQSQPRVSRHLKVLTDAGLLERFREGSWVFHRFPRDEGAAETARRLAAMMPQDDPVIALDRRRLDDVKRWRSEAAAAYFEENAPHWREVRSLYVDEREVESALARHLQAAPVQELLDIGTGTGRMLEVFGPMVGHAEGIDLSSGMLAVARANLERAGLDNCAVRQANMYRLPFPAESFGAVTVHQVLHFADDPGRVIAEAARVLRRDGRLLIADFAPHDVEFLRDRHKHRRLGFADGEVAAWLAQAGLEATDIDHLRGDPLTVAIWSAFKTGRQATPRRAARSAA